MQNLILILQLQCELQKKIHAANAKDDGKWITTESGSHIHLDKDGVITVGAGGKFNGKKLSDMGGTKKFTQYQTVAERNKPNLTSNKKDVLISSPSQSETHNKKSEGSIMATSEQNHALEMIAMLKGKENLKIHKRTLNSLINKGEVKLIGSDDMINVLGYDNPNLSKKIINEAKNKVLKDWGILPDSVVTTDFYYDIMDRVEYEAKVLSFKARASK